MVHTHSATKFTAAPAVGANLKGSQDGGRHWPQRVRPPASPGSYGSCCGGAVPQMALMHHGRAASAVQTGPRIRTSALSATFSARTTATDRLAVGGTERYRGHAVPAQTIHLLRDLGTVCPRGSA